MTHDQHEFLDEVQNRMEERIEVETDDLDAAEKVIMAQQLISLAIQLLGQSLHELPNINKEAYVYHHLRVVAGESYSGHAPSLADWAEELYEIDYGNDED